MQLEPRQAAALLVAAKFRHAERHAESAVHAAADAHLAPMTVAVMYAFMKGRKAYKAGGIDDATEAVHDALLESLPSVLLKVLVAGGQAGISMLKVRTRTRLAAAGRHLSGRALADPPFKLQFNVNSPEAIDWAKKHAGLLAKNLSETTHDDIKAAIARAVEGGGRDEAADEILDAVGSEARADLIARTEVMDAANEGLAQSWDQAVDAGLLPADATKVWIATSGACDECDDLDGEEVGLDDDFSVGDDPPAHPNCLPGSSLVLSGSRVTATSKRWFDGNVVVVRVAGDRELTCTPNHPILTPSGWIAACLLNIGDDVICDGRSQWSVDHQEMPATIQDVADAFAEASGVSASSVPTSDEDFHGDGEGSEVAIIRTDRSLRNSKKIPFVQQVVQQSLVNCQSPVYLSDRCAEAQLVEVGTTPTACGVGGSNLSGSLQLRHARPLQGLGFRLATNPNTSFSEPAVNDRSSDVQLACELIDGNACQVFTDKVVYIEQFPFHGLVYNLETEAGWFAVEGIITHNCRCTMGIGEGKG